MKQFLVAGACLALLLAGCNRLSMKQQLSESRMNRNEAILSAIQTAWLAGYTCRRAEELGIEHELVSSNKIVGDYAVALGLTRP